MKTCLTLILLITFINASAQQKHFVSLRSLAHFDFAMKMPSMDDAGFGLQMDASLFAKNRLNFLSTFHIEHLLGDKDYFIPNEGRINNQGKIIGVQAGPEYFIMPGVALSAVYGVFWHSIHEVKFAADDGYKLGLTYLVGKQKKFVMQLALTEIPRQVENISYWQFGLGYRFY